MKLFPSTKERFVLSLLELLYLAEYFVKEPGSFS